MDFAITKKILNDKHTYLVYGKSDPFINEDRITEMKSLTNQLSIAPEIKVFDGKHDIDAQTLLTFV